MKNKNLNRRLKSKNPLSTYPQGFSLIELVFAMFFLGIIILGVVNLQSSNLAIMNRQNNQIQANLIANEGIQILKGMGYTAGYAANCKNNSCELVKPINYQLSNTGKKEVVGNFERRVKVDDTGLTDAYKVTVYVEWEDGTGEHREIVKGKKVNGHVEAKAIIFN